MNKRQENKLTMYGAVLTLLQENGEKIQSVAGFKDAVTEFDAVIGKLKTKSIEVDGATAGKTAGKHSAEDGLVGCLLPVCSALYVYGIKQNNAEIKERTNISETKLRKMRDTELASYGSAVADMADLNIKNLAQFGLTPDKVAELRAKAGAYSNSIGVRESSVADRIGARAGMKSLFDKADMLLNEEMDKYMELIRPLEAEFYSKYFAARAIKDIGVRHRQEDSEPAAAQVRQ